MRAKGILEPIIIGDVFLQSIASVIETFAIFYHKNNHFNVLWKGHKHIFWKHYYYLYLWSETLLTRKLAASSCIWADLFTIAFQTHSRWDGT